VRLDRFDLNLLIALHALLEEQSVTQAAKRMNLTQSAMSAALARLRSALNDELLIQHGRKMLLSAHARALAPQVAKAIQDMRTLISGATAFDPAISERRFEIAASDYITSVLIAPLLSELKREAPHVQLKIALPTEDSKSLLLDGKLDFFLTPAEYQVPDQPNQLLFEERHVVVGWSENQALRSGLTEEAFYASGHVAVEIVGVSSFIERHMHGQDQRKIEVYAPSFTLVPWMLPGTQLLALMHERLARLYEPLLPLLVVDAPFPLPIMREMIQYHAAREDDAGLQWLLAKFLRAAETTDAKRAY
jgi:DNA-binding transcriptional LysR family regulator